MGAISSERDCLWPLPSTKIAAEKRSFQQALNLKNSSVQKGRIVIADLRAKLLSVFLLGCVHVAAASVLVPLMRKYSSSSYGSTFGFDEEEDDKVRLVVVAGVMALTLPQ